MINTFDSTGQTLSTFTLFPELEDKLRVKIWKAFDAEPRVLYLSRKENTGIYRFTIELTCGSPVPALLHTTRESREAVIDSYRFLMKDTEIYINLSPRSKDIMYFSDLETYQFYLDHYLTLAWGRKSVVKNMATLAEVSEGLQHLVFGDVFGVGLKPFSRYTRLRAVKSVGLPEGFLNSLGDSDDSGLPGKKLIELWAKAWQRVRAERAPELMMMSEEDSEMLSRGDCEPWLKRVKKSSEPSLETALEKGEADAQELGLEVEMADESHETEEEYMEE